MERKMFCYQCEQTAGCTACTGNAGVCGKRADTARLQDKLTGALIGLARATEGNEYLITGDTSRLVLEGLFTTVTNVNFNNDTITELIRRVEKERERLVPDCFVCAYQLNISSTKSMTGHLLGAAGAVEAILCIMAINDGIIPPTINHAEGDDDPEIDYKLNFTFNKAQKREVKAALSNTFGFGGHNACAIVKKFVK